VVLDVREPDEYEQGALPGAVHIPRGHLESQIENRVADRDAPLVVYCAGGTRSAFAADTLTQLGYTDVVSVVGGLQQVEERGPCLVRPPHAHARPAQPLPAPPPPARGG
jgi:rhodanese-related sulfurtransferase